MKKDLPICSPSGFARAGCGVLVASDGNEALGLFLKLHTSISDVRMPFLSGVDLAEVAELYGCPVLLISGSALPSSVSSRGREFLLKPFRCEDLLRSAAKRLAGERRGFAPRARVLVA